jgi:hypothetical protein
MTSKKPSRRRFLAGLAATVGAFAAAGRRPIPSAHSAPSDSDPRYLITFGMFGGASIIDSFLPVVEEESANAGSINAFPAAAVSQPNGSNLRAADWAGNFFGSPYQTTKAAFLAKHMDDMLVATMTGTSVNHTVAQKRAITGNGAFNGRTLQEAVAGAYGADCPLANVNMSSNGFAAHGDDLSLPGWAYMEPVPVPLLWPFALHGSRGVKVTEGSEIFDGPSDDLIAMARSLRNEKLDPESKFYEAFQLSPRLARWRSQRDVVQPQLEQADLITKLNALTEAMGLPLGDYDLASSPDADAVLSAFPRLGHDPLHAQAALAYLLIKHDIAVSVSLGPNSNITLGGPGDPAVLNPPLSFDNSHTAHRTTQAVMWERMLEVADGLITLLKGVETSPGSGVSKWDRSMIYCASDFGRSKGRTNFSTSFGSGHELNNGILAISPMLAGNQVLGGVDSDTAMTYGFDPQSGAPDTGRLMFEHEIYAGLTQALGIDTGLPDMSAMVG